MPRGPARATNAKPEKGFESVGCPRFVGVGLLLAKRNSPALRCGLGYRVKINAGIWPTCPALTIRTSNPSALTGTGEKQNMPVGVFKLEATQTVIGVLKRFREGDTARRKFGRQRIRIGY